MEHIYQKSCFGEDWFTYPQLYKEYANGIGDGSVFVEVGSWKGKSISFLAVELVNLKKTVACYAVDTWAGSSEHQEHDIVKADKLYDLFLSNIDPIKTVVTPIRKPSTQAAQDFADRSIDIVFIDAAHEYDPVKEDILAWLPKVKLGGILSGHDYLHEGVKKAVDEVFGNKVIFRNAMENCWIIEVKE